MTAFASSDCSRPSSPRGAERGKRSGKAGKLDRVAEPLFGVEEEALAGDRFAPPFAPLESAVEPDLLFPAPFVFPPAVGEIAEQQREQALVKMKIGAVR